MIKAVEAKRLATIINNTSTVCELVSEEIRELATNHGLSKMEICLNANINSARRINDRWVTVENNKFYLPDRDFNIPNLVNTFTELGFEVKTLRYKTYAPSYDDSDSEEFNYISIRW